MLTLNGTGTVKADGLDLGQVSYRIVLDQRGTIKTTTGSYTPLVPLQPLPGKSSRVALVTDENGFEIVIDLKSQSGDGSATFAVLGPVSPGA